jgi:beta-ureidopropionase
MSSLAVASKGQDRDEHVVADLDLDEVQEVRTHWQFYRDRRPEMYGPLNQM